MKKIENGELVELSSAGKKLQQNSDVVGLFGLVMRYEKGQHPYKIQWFKDNRVSRSYCKRLTWRQV